MPNDVVWTGFGTFPGVERNPSRDAAMAAAEVGGGRCEILEVTYEAVRTWRADPPAPPEARWIHLGVGTSRDDVCVEVTAYNRAATDREDADGARPDARLTDEPGAPDALSTAMNPAAVVDALADPLTDETGFVVRTSRDPGGYVCNALYFWSLWGRAGGERLFIHMPMVDSNTARTLGGVLASVLQPSRS